MLPGARFARAVLVVVAVIVVLGLILSTVTFPSY
jgi:putative copper export protein